MSEFAIPNQRPEYNPNRSLLEQALSIVGFEIGTISEAEADEKLTAEHPIDAHEAETYRH
jgi:hypothetical protein